MPNEIIIPGLVKKYDQHVPRYTSYPAHPYWNEKTEIDQWKQAFTAKFDQENPGNGISIYIHLPFCESLCTFCGCNKKITTNHDVENEYIRAIHNEWSLYRKLMKQTPVIRELHVGGGTPTFFSPSNLKRLLQHIIDGSIIHPKYDFSIEGHPNSTRPEHLKVLYSLGFRRISYGVQDLDPEVQRVINRIQPFENVMRATLDAKAAGFTSVNFDLIYGLPLQTLQSIENTINKISELKPDRIAYYSYAHVPWKSRAQRLFDESDLPGTEEKLQLYIKGMQMLLDLGYEQIGMDHFALPGDELYKVWKAGKMHRNFMGYTTQKTGLLLGLGVSSISDSGNAFAQNEKTLHDYYEAVYNGRLAINKGLLLSEQDVAIRKYILDIICKGETVLDEKDRSFLATYTLPKLTEFETDGLITLHGNKINLTGQGHYFMRNVCSAFDQYIHNNTNSQVFSKSV